MSPGPTRLHPRAPSAIRRGAARAGGPSRRAIGIALGLDARRAAARRRRAAQPARAAARRHQQHLRPVHRGAARRGRRDVRSRGGDPGRDGVRPAHRRSRRDGRAADADAARRRPTACWRPDGSPAAGAGSASTSRSPRSGARCRTPTSASRRAASCGCAATAPATCAKGTDTNGKSSPDSIRLAYVRAGSESWWSILPAVAHRMGLDRGRIFDGAWMFLAWVALLLALVAVVTVAAVAACAAAAPRAPDPRGRLAVRARRADQRHGVGTRHARPSTCRTRCRTSRTRSTSPRPASCRRRTASWPTAPEEEQALASTEFYMVVGDVDARPPWTEARDRAMDAERPGEPRRQRHAQSATNNPPLYYAMEAVAVPDRQGARPGPARPAHADAVPVRAVRGGDGAGRVPVRARGPALDAVGVDGRRPGGALQPLFGFVSSGVQGDALLYTAGAVLLLGLARAFRRGLDAARGRGDRRRRRPSA